MADDMQIGADEVSRKEFSTSFRGFDQYEVRAFLSEVAAELARSQERARSLADQLARSEEKPPPRQIVEEEMEAALGAETTRVLHAAREAAAEIRAKAEESVGRLVREAGEEAARLRSEAESMLARRTEEAEAAASAILSAAQESASALRAEAESSAAATIEQATQRGREMVGEAQAVRERVLKDLARRRKATAIQLEQLLAGRERLLSAYDVVRRTVDEATGELSVAEAEAKLAADVAGLKPPPEDDGEIPGAEPAPSADEHVEEEHEEPVTTAASEPTRAEPPEPEPEPKPLRPVAAPATAVATATDAPVVDDRRSSSLRLLRRRSETTTGPLPADGDDLEGVRIIRPEPAAEAARPEEPPAEEPEEELEPGPDVVPIGGTEAEASPDEAAAEPAAEPVAEPDAASSDKPVDDLFARLRADRQAAVAQAEEVLASPSAPVDATDEPDAAIGVDTETEPEEEPEAEQGDARFEERDAAVEPAERALTRALKRALADEQNEVLDSLRRLRGVPAIDALLPVAEEHTGRYVAVAAEHLAMGASAGAESLEGKAPSIDELASALAAEVADDLRSKLERALDANAGDDEALVETISATYREWKTSRAEPLARHHVAAAYALGAFSAAPDGDLLWVVDAAEGGCPDCDDNALAGPTAKGEVFPTGQLHPPAHAGCRCLALPAS